MAPNTLPAFQFVSIHEIKCIKASWLEVPGLASAKKKTWPQTHEGLLHSYFQSEFADVFRPVAETQQPDSTIALPTIPSDATLFIQDKDMKMLNSGFLKQLPQSIQ